MSVCCGVGPIVDAINSGNVSVRRGASVRPLVTPGQLWILTAGESVLPVPCSLLSWGRRGDLFPLLGGVSCPIPALH